MFSSSSLGAVALAVLAIAAMPSQAAVIYNNGSPSTGPVTTDGVAAPAGTTWAESTGGTIGWTNSVNASGNIFTLADDFTVAPGTTWSISSIRTLAYVSDVGIESSPITGVSLRIWSGTPGTAGATVVWGDLTTNLMASSTFSGIYRSELNFANVSRPLWEQSATTSGLVLGAGTYWVEYLTKTRSSSTRAFGVPVHVDGLTAAPGANGLQSTFTASTGLTTWAQVVDSGVQQVQAVPFTIEGSISAVPEPATAALWLMGASALAAAGLHRRRG